MTAWIFLLSLVYGFSAWSDPGLDLIGAKERLTACQNQMRKGYSFSPNELILSLKQFKDPACKEIAEINRFKMTCEFSKSDATAVCRHTGRGHSTDGSNWDTLPVDAGGAKVQVNVRALGRGSLEINMTEAGAAPTQDILKKN